MKAANEVARLALLAAEQRPASTFLRQLLGAMSLFALLGVRYPARLLPLLLLETAWKVLWLSAVALPKAIAGDLDPATTTVLVNCSLVVVIAAVIPWRYAWCRFVLEKGEPWRTTRR